MIDLMNGIGFTLSLSATAIKIGNTNTVAALFVISSVRIIVAKYTAANVAATELAVSNRLADN